MANMAKYQYDMTQNGAYSSDGGIRNTCAAVFVSVVDERARRGAKV